MTMKFGMVIMYGMLKLFCSLINMKLLLLQITVKIIKKKYMLGRNLKKKQILKGHNSLKIN